MGDDIVVPYAPKVELVYLGKFEIDINKLTKYCFDNGVAIWCVSINQHMEEQRFAFQAELNKAPHQKD
jgi:hypothetical protein